jgi:protein SCO1
MSRFTLGTLICLAFCGCKQADPPLGEVSDFQLTTQAGKTLSRDDLKSKVWVADFIFTRCTGPCRQITGSMASLQEQLVGQKDVYLVSFSVDPEHDTPAVLAEYAKQFSADPERWFFLSGDRAKMYEMIEKGFKLGVAQNEGTARTPGNEVMHSTRLALVDKQGKIRGYFDGTDENSIKELRQKIALLLREAY